MVRRLEIVIGQLVDRCNGKRGWARGPWHLGRRVPRQAPMHMVAVLLNANVANPPSHRAQIVAQKPRP
jgi:hypothetical protein